MIDPPNYIPYWKKVLATFNFESIIPKLLKLTNKDEAESFIEDNASSLASLILSVGKDITTKNGKIYCECGYEFKDTNEATQSYCNGCLEGLAHEEYPGEFYDDICTQNAEDLLKSAWIDLHKKT